jgi:hypothetical protein
MSLIVFLFGSINGKSIFLRLDPDIPDEDEVEATDDGKSKSKCELFLMN